MVLSAATTDMPNIQQLENLFAQLPANVSNQKGKPPIAWYTKLQAYILEHFPVKTAKGNKRPARPPTPYNKLKMGEKTIVLAVNDAGTQSYFRFSSTDFAANAWMGELKFGTG